jgi:hypothetical protein
VTKLRPFFTYYGGKWRTALRYPAPTHDRIIEPFAGSAGYAVRYPDRAVDLYDADERVIGVWQYLIAAEPDEIMRLPVVVTDVRSLDMCQEAKWLIGFWLNKGSEAPRLTATTWMRSGLCPNSYWGDAIRSRIAAQVPAIKHWTAQVSDYADVPLVRATWLVDPPYDHKSAIYYREKVRDFDHLGNWCRALPGQVIVCEREGASWLPFTPVAWVNRGTRGRSPEAIWEAA